ncbi:DnaJ subfamily C member 2 protein [Thraustotheca clavata]|uniref:DnaJ subfamily C member 2 protein n=1 Tax=Thraustotheca clavata TaxID=74557 RepID=A0A1V9Y711_9STRA|nr:DnaJ subfamily C member 2 protein [Thraustotheca clavata]
MLALPPPPASAKDGLVLGLGGYPYLKRVEIAGRSLHKRVRNAARGRSLSMESNGENDARAEAKLKEEAILAKYRKSIKGKNFINLTMYQQLGLTDVMFDATPEQIKKAYHRVLIEHHPDKTLKDENDPNYLAVQKAFNTLMDPQKKRAYDSQCEFDESIPSGSEKIKQNVTGKPDPKAKYLDFYALYGPVFERNSRFSTVTPVPHLGDDETPLEEVQSFYNFWHTFESWRDFTHNAEHDVDSVESRDEKRFMMKKNEAQAKKLKKQEYNRLADLVSRAQLNDPRLRRVKQAAKNKKENERKAKEAAAQAIIDAQKAAEEAAARLKAEKEDAEKKLKTDAKMAKEKMKKAFRKVKKVFRELTEAVNDPRVDVEETEYLCESIEMDAMVALNTALGGSTDSLKAGGIEDVAKLLTSLRGDAYMQKKAAKRG